MGASILIIDDEMQVVQMLKLLLCDDAERIDGVTSPQQARARLAERTYDAVVSDICLPGESGIDLLREASATTPATRWIMITAYGKVETEVECRSLGVAAYFTKPFNLGDVRNAVRNLLPS